MNHKFRLIVIISIVIVLLSICALAYDFVIGFPRVLDGTWVQRRTKWNSTGLGSLAVYRSRLFYYYIDAQGHEVRHGPYREFHANRTKRIAGSYRHGEREGKWTEWNVNGEKISEGMGSFPGPREIRGIAPHGRPEVER